MSLTGDVSGLLPQKSMSTVKWLGNGLIDTANLRQCGTATNSVDSIGEIAKGVLPLLGFLDPSPHTSNLLLQSIPSNMANLQRVVISLLLILTAAFVFLAQTSAAAKGPKITNKVSSISPPPGVALQLTAASRSFSISRTGMRNWAESS